MPENAKIRTKGRVGRILAAALLAAATTLTAFVAPAAAVEVGDSVWVGNQTQGYSGTPLHSVYSPIPADKSNPGDPQLWAYCIENQVSARTNADAVVGDFSSHLGSNYFSNPVVQAKVYWVITHSYPALSLEDLGAAAGVADLDVNDAIEATQYAIWRYTDLTFDAAWAWETPASEAVYWYLVNGANADTATTPPASVDIEVSITAPAAPGATGSLYGPFVVSTNQPTVSVSSNPAYTITDSAGTPINVNSVVDGQELYLDLTSVSTAGSATITATAQGASGNGYVLSTPVAGSTTATPDSHAQSMILVAADSATTTASANGSWTAAAVPAIGTTLVDDADGDHNLAWNGGTVVDTVAYTGLTVGTEYTVSGELMQSDGSGTGIVGSTTFTPTTADGSVEVTFTVPTGYAGDTLVAFEYLYLGDTATGTPIAEHTDINDAAQTVTVSAEPTIGTTLVDDADGDHNLVWNGGTVVDTVAYTGLTVGTEYTVSGELMQSDGSGTGIVGSTTFTPTTADGSVEVTFTVPTGYAGDTLVAFEYLYLGDTATSTPIAEHTDINDAAQTVIVDEQPLVPAIGTTLVDAVDGDQVLPWNGGTVVDTVAFTGLTVGTEYTISGELMLQSDGSGTGITGSTTFTPTTSDGSVEVAFTVPTGYAGDALVAFEYLYVGDTATGTPIAEHTDIEDAAQTVTVSAEPTIGTTLVDDADGDHNLVWNGGTVVDTIAYTGLTVGTEYTMSGELMLQSDGSGTGITGSTTFTPTTADGSVEVTFTVPVGYAGDALVAFEYLYVGDTATGTPIAEHTDLQDAAQTVTVEEEPLVPAIGTTLVDDADGDHILPWNGGTVVDTVAYTGLTVGTEYTVSGELMQSDGTGTGITGSTTFTPTTADGSVEVTFVVPTGYAGDALVAFEYLYVGDTATGTPIAEHTDIEDAAQTVTVEEQPVVPAIGTTLLDSADDDHNLVWNGGTVIDTVAYTGLTVGTEYTVSGELMHSDGSGTGIVGSTTFTPTTVDGSVEVTFTVPTGYAGEALVAFEYLYVGATATGTPIAEHTDIEDAAQTVTVEEQPAVPAIGTTLVDGADGDHVLPWNGGTVVDTIAYTGLTPGVEYTVSGELMLKSDGSGTGITGSTTFTPTEADGSVEVTFVVPSGYAGDALVAFEYLHEGSTAEGEPIAEHTDIDDVNQTVTVEEQPVVPAIGTTLLDSSDQDHVLPSTGGTLVDTVAYTGLTPGVEYTVSGELMRKSDGSGTGIVGSTTFTPTAADGSVDVAFTVPAGYAGQELVAFEYVHVGATASGTPVAEHTDIDDASQTVSVQNAPTTPVTPVKPTGTGLATTGGALPLALTSGAAMALLAGAVLLTARRRSRSEV